MRNMHHHKSLLRKAFQIIPPLDGTLHKGQAGRIGIVGGSEDYTGAPYFASYASLRLGSDLAHVICEPSASRVIKTYSPDLMVHSYLSSSIDSETYHSNQVKFDNLLNRLHALVVGPGLGRDQELQNWARWAIQIAVQKNIHLVLDADALWLLQSHPDIIKGYQQVILTPNRPEFERLLKAYSIPNPPKKPEEDDDQNDELLSLQLSKALGGCTILLKSSVDLVVKDGLEPVRIRCQGSPKRCGGQGDILSGLVGTWSAWAKLYLEKQKQSQPNCSIKEGNTFELITEEEGIMLSAILGSEITRTSSRLTYEKFGRSMQSSDILTSINLAFDHVMHGHTKD